MTHFSEIIKQKTKVEENKLMKELVRDIIEKYNIKKPIKNISNVIRLMGGEVIKTPNLLRDFSVRNDDIYYNHSKSFFTINISNDYDIETEQFMVAYQLGHIILDMGYLIAPEEWDKQPINTSLEITEYQQERLIQFAQEFLLTQIVHTNNKKVAIEVLSAQDMIDTNFGEIKIKSISNNQHCMNDYDAIVTINDFEFVLYRDLNFRNVDIKKFINVSVNNIDFRKIE